VAVQEGESVNGAAEDDEKQVRMMMPLKAMRMRRKASEGE
jgi:hypothetical protein